MMAVAAKQDSRPPSDLRTKAPARRSLAHFGYAATQSQALGQQSCPRKKARLLRRSAERRRSARIEVRYCVISAPKYRLILRLTVSQHEWQIGRDPGGEKPAISRRTEKENRQVPSTRGEEEGTIFLAKLAGCYERGITSHAARQLLNRPTVGLVASQGIVKQGRGAKEMDTSRLRSSIRSSIRTFLAGGLVVAWCASVPAGSVGAFAVETQAGVNWGSFPGEFGGADFGIATASYTDGYSSGGSFTATADAEAAYGVLKAKATGTTVNATYLVQGAEAIAIFTDEITFTTVPPNGRAEFVFTLTGGSTGLPAKAKLTVINHSKGGISHSVDLITTAGDYRLIIPVDFNVVQTFEFVLEASFRISMGASETQTADFGQTATMTAIDLFDAGASPISSFDVSAASGTTYPISFPAPALSRFGIAAVCALLALARWRRLRG